MKYLVVFTISVFMMSCGQFKKDQWVFTEKIYTQDIYPVGICLYGANIMVSSRKNDKVATVSLDGRILDFVSDYKTPMRMMSRGGRLIIPEFENNRIAIKTGNEILIYPMVEFPDGPMAADVTSGKIVVADYNNHRIIFLINGKNKTFGNEGAKHGEFRYPTDVQFFNKLIYVADNQNKRIEIFNLDGKYEKTIGENANLSQASGLFVWKDGIAVCDMKKGQIVIFDHDGNVVQIVEEGLERPSDVFVLAKKMYVADEVGGFIGILEK